MYLLEEWCLQDPEVDSDARIQVAEPDHVLHDFLAHYLRCVAAQQAESHHVYDSKKSDKRQLIDRGVDFKEFNETQSLSIFGCCLFQDAKPCRISLLHKEHPLEIRFGLFLLQSIFEFRHHIAHRYFPIVPPIFIAIYAALLSVIEKLHTTHAVCHFSCRVRADQ